MTMQNIYQAPLQIGDRVKFNGRDGTVTNFDQLGDPLITFADGHQSLCAREYVQKLAAEAACTPGQFDGIYDKGTIKFGVVTLKQNGYTTMLYFVGGHTVEIELQGKIYQGKRLSNGSIQWSNSHLWKKLPKKPESCLAGIGRMCSSDKSRAKEVLRRAQLKGTIPDLVLAVKSVKAAGLASSFRNNIVAAETMLAAAQNKVKLELVEAVATGTKKALENAIMKAKAAGLPREDILAADERLVGKAAVVEEVDIVDTNGNVKKIVDLVAPAAPVQASIYFAGQQVECRDRGEEWRRGTITSTVPLEARLDGQSCGFEWEEIRPLQAPVVVKQFQDTYQYATPSITMAQSKSNVQTVYASPRSPTAYRAASPGSPTAYRVKASAPDLLAQPGYRLCA